MMYAGVEASVYFSVAGVLHACDLWLYKAGPTRWALGCRIAGKMFFRVAGDAWDIIRVSCHLWRW